MELHQVVHKLHQLADADKVIYKERKFGIITKNSLGIYHKDLSLLAKEIGKNNLLAVQLFDTGIYEARILCSKIYDPKDATEELLEKWVKTFDNWEICDSFSMGIFAKSKFALAKILEWTSRKPEFEKRAGFAILASYCMADKKAENEIFEQLLPIISREASDERLYVKKSVNWALRNIGKRNIDLRNSAIRTAQKIQEQNSVSAKWIAANALRELQNKNVRSSDYPRSIYRPVYV